MKYLPDKTGRFRQRPHYIPEEIDRDCEDIITSFLSNRYKKVDFPVSTEDLTVLIEQRVEDLDQYADLSGYGMEVEGITVFERGRMPTVRIAARLANDERRENRLRTTLSHEFGHVHLHRHLWDLEPWDADLHRGNSNIKQQTCKRANLLDVAQADWMEWQAGYVSGSLLMPVSYVRRIVGAYKDRENLFGGVAVSGRHGQALIQAVKQEFRVSAQAACIRLLKLRLLVHTDSGPSLFG